MMRTLPQYLNLNSVFIGQHTNLRLYRAVQQGQEFDEGLWVEDFELFGAGGSKRQNGVLKLDE